jgi:hypothetical protein
MPWLSSRVYPLRFVSGSALILVKARPSVRCPSLYPVCSRNFPPYMMSKLLPWSFSQSYSL